MLTRGHVRGHDRGSVSVAELEELTESHHHATIRSSPSSFPRPPIIILRPSPLTSRLTINYITTPTGYVSTVRPRTESVLTTTRAVHRGANAGNDASCRACSPIRSVSSFLSRRVGLLGPRASPAHPSLARFWPGLASGLRH